MTDLRHPRRRSTDVLPAIVLAVGALIALVLYIDKPVPVCPPVVIVPEEEVVPEEYGLLPAIECERGPAGECDPTEVTP